MTLLCGIFTYAFSSFAQGVGCDQEPIVLHMFDDGNDGWQGGQYEVFTFLDELVASGSLMSGGQQSDTLCLSPQCHKIVVDGGLNPSEISWLLTTVGGEDLFYLEASPIAQFFSLGSTCPEVGCTDPASANYDPEAIWDNNSCVPTGLGCTDTTAGNFDPEALVDDGSCEYGVIGCNDPFAANYWSLAEFNPGNECVWGDYKLAVDDQHLVLTSEEGDKRQIQISVLSPSQTDVVISVFSTPESNPVSLDVQNDGSFYNHPEGGISSNDIDPDQFGEFPNLEFDSHISIGGQMGEPIINFSETAPGDGLANSFSVNEGPDLYLTHGSWATNPPFTAGLIGTDGTEIFSLTTSDAVCGTLNFNLQVNGNAEYEVDFHNLPFCSWPYDGCGDPSAANFSEWSLFEHETCAYGGYPIIVDQIYQDDGSVSGYPIGFSTYRIYAYAENPTDILDAVFADPLVSPVEIATSGQFWNHPGAGTFGSQIPNGTTNDDLIYYDSYWTIGLDNDLDPGSVILENLEAWNLFNSGNLDGAIIPKMELKKSECNEINGLVEQDVYRVLIAQVTTDGTLSGNINLRWLIEGDCNEVAHIYNLEFQGADVQGCTDSIADNYNPVATLEDDSCVYPDCDLNSLSLEWACQDEQEGFLIFSENNGFCFEGELEFALPEAPELPIFIDLNENFAPLADGETYFIPLDLEECTEYDVTLTTSGLQAPLPPITAHSCESVFGCDDVYASNYVEDVTCLGPCLYDECSAISLTGSWTCDYNSDTEETTSGLMILADFVGPCVVDSICLSIVLPEYESCIDLDEFDIEIMDSVETFIPLNVPFDEEYIVELKVMVGNFSEYLDIPLFPCIAGCIESNALNFNSLATITDGSCEFPCSDNQIDITINPGNDPDEVIWELTDEFGEVVYLSGGPYISLDEIIETICLPDSCYRFVMHDLSTPGDGWTDGSYSIEIDGNIIHSGGLDNGDLSFDFISIGTDCDWIDGCTDNQAINYSIQANFEDGSCEYEGVDGAQDDLDLIEGPNILSPGSTFTFNLTSLNTGSNLYIYLLNTNGSVSDFWQMSSEQLTDDTGKVTLDMSQNAAGIYYLQIILGSKTQMVPLFLIDK